MNKDMIARDPDLTAPRLRTQRGARHRRPSDGGGALDPGPRCIETLRARPLPAGRHRRRREGAFAKFAGYSELRFCSRWRPYCTVNRRASERELAGRWRGWAPGGRPGRAG